MRIDRLPPKPDPRTLSPAEVQIVNPCCTTFVKAVAQYALRLFPDHQDPSKVRVYVGKAVQDCDRKEPHHNIRFCPWCGEKLR